MAANNVVASVAVLIRPITKGFKKNIQDAYKEAVQEIQPEAPEVPDQDYEEPGKRHGSKFGQAFAKWAKRSLAVVGVAAGAAVGAAFVSGFRSAVDQQQGQLVLSGLYGDADKARKTLEGIRGVASGSPIDYSAYQSAAESLAYAGAEGEDAIGVLENVGKAITAAGGDSSNMDRATDALLSGVNAGKFQLDTLQQLSDAGIPILSGLAEHFGVSMEDVNKMASEGKIQLDDVMSVMQNGTGEIFQQMIGAGEEAANSFGNQWKIAKDNVAVAIGRVMLPFIEMLAPAIKPAADAVVGFVEQIPGMLDGIRDGVQWIKDNIAWIGTLGTSLAIAGAAAWVASGGLTAVGLSIKGVFLAISTGIRSIPVIGWVIAAIGLLVTALVYVFTQTEWGQKVWEKVWGAIKTAASATWDWIKNTLWPGILTVWDAISSGAIWMYENAILPAWSGIKTAVSATVDWLVNTAWPFIKSVWDAIAGAALWLWRSVIQPVWDGIRIAIAIAVTAILVYIDLLKWYFDSVIAPVAMWLWNNVMKPVWSGIKSAISAVVDWFQNTAWPILSAVIDWIATKFDQFKIGLGIIWNFIKNQVIAPVVSWFQNTVWPLIDTVLGWIQMSFEGWKIILGAVWDFVKNNIIKPVVTWFRDTAWPLIDKVLGLIKTGFNTMRDSLKAAWKFIQDNVIAPVVNWLTDTVKPKFDTFTDNVKKAFTTLKDGVLAAWDSIKEGMKAPINGVIGIYNKHIAGNFNDVIDTIFGKDGGKKYKLGTMSEFHTGGYTGPGAKYTPAGVVHADEYVIRKESQNDLRRKAPGFLDALNQFGASALGYAGGGRVKLRMPFNGNYPRGDGYGARGGRHKGIDWPMPSGALLKAVGAGTVSHTWNSSAGRKLELAIGNGLVAGYHHLSSYIAGQGASVGAGANVARVGSTGRSSGPHLHFSLKRNGSYVDPAPYLGAGGFAGASTSGSGTASSWWNPFDGLWASIKDQVSSAVGEGTMGGMLSGVVENTVGGISGWVTDQLSAIGDFGTEVVSSAGSRARWAPVMANALRMKGQWGINRQRWGLDRLMQESSGDPNAVNTWDSNARRGTPSKGLMQVIGPTFRAYAEPGHSSNILDPLSNILASINYTLATYGSLQAGWTRKGGYADGGLVGPPTLFDSGGVLPPGLSTVLNASRKPEAVLTNEQLQQLRTLTSRDPASGDTFQVFAENDKAAELVSELMWAQKTRRRSGRYAHVRR